MEGSMRVTMSTVLVICAAVIPAHAQQPAPATIPVGVVKAERTAISRT